MAGLSFDQVVEQARVRFFQADISTIDGLLAIQFNLTGEGGGTFYAEVKNSVLSVEPYAYYDRNAALTMSTADFLDLITGKADAIALFTQGKLKVDGDIGAALQVNGLLGN